MCHASNPQLLDKAVRAEPGVRAGDVSAPRRQTGRRSRLAAALQIGALLVAVSFSGCAASRQYFQPTERVRGSTLQGYPEAIYELVGPAGPFGEAKVWSRGSYRGPNKATVVHVSIEIHNTSAVPTQLNAADVKLDPVRTRDGVLAGVTPAENGVYSVPPGTIREARFHFVLPPGTSPGDVRGFRVGWSVSNAGHPYPQQTPFIPEVQSSYYGYAGMYPYHYFCDPFDPFCFYRGPYYYPYGYGVGYGTVVVRPEAPPPRVVVHPRR
jgi:hypothetical protein